MSECNHSQSVVRHSAAKIDGVTVIRSVARGMKLESRATETVDCVARSVHTATALCQPSATSVLADERFTCVIRRLVSSAALMGKAWPTTGDQCGPMVRFWESGVM